MPSRRSRIPASKHDFLRDVLSTLIGVSNPDWFLFTLGWWRWQLCRHYDGRRGREHCLAGVIWRPGSIRSGVFPRAGSWVEGSRPWWLDGILLRVSHVRCTMTILGNVVLVCLGRKWHVRHGHHDGLVWGINRSRGGL